MTKPARHFLASLAAPPSTEGVSRQIVALVDGLPVETDAHADQHGITRLYGWLTPHRIDDETERALTVRFLEAVASGLLRDRPLTGLYIMRCLDNHVSSQTLDDYSRRVLDLFMDRRLKEAETDALLLYVRSACRRDRVNGLPASSVDLFYLVGIAAKNIDELSAAENNILLSLREQLTAALNVFGVAGNGNISEHFRTLAESPQQLLEKGEATPDEAIRRVTLGNRFFQALTDSGLDVLGRNRDILTNVVSLLDDQPNPSTRITSLGSIYDAQAYRTDLAFRGLCSSWLPKYVCLKPYLAEGQELAEFAELEEQVLALMNRLQKVEDNPKGREAACSNLLMAVASATVLRDLPQPRIDACLQLIAPYASLEAACDLATPDARRVLVDFTIRLHFDQASFLSLEDRKEQLIQDLGI